jgi:hypothetical protein
LLPLVVVLLFVRIADDLLFTSEHITKKKEEKKVDLIKNKQKRKA